ncbi:lipopolysaccharide heptosyltransferase family protein [Chlorobium phaeovibrioides]|uniref:Lipopolysaccharide heptosyltransferase family protein n=2 Tax=Chlorobium phaeovibrioides TaxID=1094 RepID=A0A432AT55_CHLPH|nr:lipopolysaccharide heptosyltransferase family protein [Chlorobium phaeovibrioides]
MNKPPMQARQKKKKKRQFRQLFARTLQHFAPKRSGSAPFTGKLESIAILAQEKLGDSVLLTPLIRNLRKAFPKLEIHIIAFSEASANFFRNDSNVTAVHQTKREPGRYKREVLKREFDVLFNTKDHPSTHFLLQSVLIKARHKVGHANEFHTGLFDQLITIEHNTHMALKNCAILPLLGVTVTEEECRPCLPPSLLPMEMQIFLRQIDTRRPTGINISAGEANRTWPETKWKKLVQSLPDTQFIVLSGPSELESKRNLERNCPNIIPSPATGNLYEASRIVETLELLVTPDTSLIHIASATATPVIGLYREAPQDITRFGPFRIPGELVISPTGEVAGISPDSVKKAVEKQLQRERPASWETSV